MLEDDILTDEKIIIYHTNDLHSNFHFWPRINAELLKKRGQYEQEDVSVLVFDIGDAADRVHPLIEATAGQAMTQLFKAAQYDAVTIGNNEGTTYSKEALNHLYDAANFSVLLANLVDLETGEKPAWAENYKVVQTRTGARIGIFGLTEPIYDAYENLAWVVRDPIEVTQKLLSKHQQQADFWIVLSHLGIHLDRKLAEKFPVDLILGGHTHHVLKEGEKIAGTWLAGAGSNGEYLGKIHLHKQNQRLKVKKINLLNTRLELEGIKDEQAQVADYLTKGHELLSAKKIAFMPRNYEKALFENSPLMQLVLDAIADFARTDVAFLNAGLLMEDLEAGEVTADHLHRMLPHPIRVMHCEVKGADIPKLVAEFTQINQWMHETTPTGYGFRGKQFGKICLKGVTVKDDKIYWLNQPVDPKQKYTFATVNYLSFYSVFDILNTHTKQQVFFPKLLREVVGDYLAKKFPIDRSK